MSESPSATFAAYGLNQSREAIAARKELPPEIQLALFDVIDALCADPREHPDRLRPISRDGKVVVYKHPDPPLEVTFEIDEGERQIYFMHFAATTVSVKKKLFVSYSHEDEEWLAKLMKWLKPLEKDGILDIWDDSRIQPGDDWRRAIEQAMRSARLALLLVSQNFLASDFIPGEELSPILDAAESEGVAVLWIAVSEAAYEETGIQKYQALNDPSTPLDSLDSAQLNKQLKYIYQKIRETALV